ncbi:hypothetical protein AKO1_007962 [Acrasis kona]|uniref:Serine protease n=1 Tax=Acrasis kona TaxID=1008807 RepID=A0AAW2YQL6_9EUKA
MRDVKHMLDVVHYHGPGSVVASAVTNVNDQLLLDVLKINDEETRKNLTGDLHTIEISADAMSFFKRRYDDLCQAAQGVFRLAILTGRSASSGSSFGVGPKVHLTNHHIVISITRQSVILASNEEAPRIADMINQGRREDVLKVESFDWHDVVPGQKDDIHGTVGDMDYVDLCPLSNAPISRVLFIPTLSRVREGAEICTISYPGDETARAYSNQPYEYQRKYLPPYQTLKEKFHGFGRKVLSYGRILNPYHAVDGVWTENKQYEADIKECHYYYSNENLHGGSSGGVTLLEDFKIFKVQDKDGHRWLLVEALSFHFGGEFIPCMKCLKILPEERGTTKHHETIGLCENCVAEQSVSYNYGTSFHHPTVIKFYKTLKNDFIELFGQVPEPIQRFYDLHAE